MEQRLGSQNHSQACSLCAKACPSVELRSLVKRITVSLTVVANVPRRIIVFARFPVSGRVKTRLIPALGPEGAVRVHRRLMLHAVRNARVACQACNAQLELHFDGADENAIQHWLGDSVRIRPQSTGDLGERMARAFEEGFQNRCGAVVLIGSDCPGLTPEILAEAFERLKHGPVVLGPATDGGYYLVGLTSPMPELFRGITWGTDQVLAQSLETLSRIAVKPAILPELADIDRPEDMKIWRRVVDAEASVPRRISVIIPTLNEAASILPTLGSVQQEHPHEVIVVDGGSTDETCQLATDSGARVILSRARRATQMNAGAGTATGNLLLFLHADTTLPPLWSRLVAETLGTTEVSAGAFGFAIAEDFSGKRIVEWGTNLRSRWRQMPYGDQALFLARERFEEEGGFADLPIMEDYEFVRRLRHRGRIVTLAQRAITSGRRWKQLGIVRTTLRNQLMIAGYHLGISPDTLVSGYRKRPGDAVE